MNTFCNTLICKNCHIHTTHKKEELENGRYRWKCEECRCSSPIYEADGKEVTEQQLKKEREMWM